MTHEPLIEQLRIWATELETETDALTHAAIVDRVIVGLREVADDLDQDGRDGHADYDRRGD